MVEGLTRKAAALPTSRPELLEGLRTGQHRAWAPLLRADPARYRSFLDWLLRQVDALNRLDPHAGLAVAEYAFELARRLPPGVYLGRALRARAHALRWLGRYEEALGAYDEAIATFEAHGEDLEALNTCAGKVTSLRYLGRYAEGLALARRSRRRLLREHGEVVRAAVQTLNIGTLRRRLGQPAAALRAYRQARAVFRAHDAREWLATAEMNIGNVLTSMDRFREAERAYAQARQLYAQLRHTRWLATLDANVGWLHLCRGDYAGALRYLVAARRLFLEAALPRDCAIASLDLARAYLELNLVADASELCEEALETFTNLEMGYERGRALLERAAALGAQRQQRAAVVSAAQAIQVFEEQSNTLWATLARLRALELGAEHPDAEEVCRNAAASLSEAGLHDRAGYAHLVLGLLQQRKGRPGEAIASFRQALAVATAFHQPWLRFAAALHLGAAQDEAGMLADAERSLLEAEAQLGEVAAGLPLDDLRVGFLDDKAALYERRLSLALRRNAPAEALFAIAEQGKSRALRLSLQEAPASDEPGPVRELRLRQQSLREQLNWHQARAASLGAQGAAESGGWQQHGTEIERLERELALLAQEIAMAAPQSARPPLQALTLAEVQAALAPGDVVLEYFVGDDELVLYVVTPDRCQVLQQVGSYAAARRLAAALRFQMGKFRYGEEYVRRRMVELQDATERCLRSLYDLLLCPAEPWLERAGRLIVVPHGTLHYLPFHAFHDGSRHLMDRLPVSYAPSASLLVGCLRRPRPRPERGLLVACDPGDLPGAQAEVEAIAALLPRPVVLVNEQATPSRVARELSSCDLFHVACHARLRTDNPSFSALRLAGGDLAVHDLRDLTIAARLVTLSACSTALSAATPGDELMGLARAFFQHGASSLVVSLWPVNDRAATQLMTSFYRALLAGAAPADALRAAALSVREEQPHPHFWAPFILTGAP